MITEIATTTATVLSIVGAAAVSIRKPDMANSIWSISNPVLVYHNLLINEIPQALLFLIFTGLAWAGCLKVIHNKKA